MYGTACVEIFHKLPPPVSVPSVHASHRTRTMMSIQLMRCIMSMVNEATFAISSIFRVVTRTAKALENVAEAGEKYSHVAVNHADLCDLESKKKKEIRLS